MIEVVRFVNSRFTSNTYIIAHPEYDHVWVVDPGDTEAVFEWMKDHSKTVISGILLTHAHFDHIYGMNDIVSRYPECVIYIANDYGKEALRDPKVNGSKYTDEGAVSIKESAHILFYNEILLLWPEIEMQVLLTPGHSDDSVCLSVCKYLFTGDTIIPNTRTVTKLKTGSLVKLNKSIQIIKDFVGKDITICPGHSDFIEIERCDFCKSVKVNYNQIIKE